MIGKYELVKHKEKWPDWAVHLYGVGEGYHCFENKQDFDEFVAKYREEHKNDVLRSWKIEEKKEMGVIGFAS